MPERKNLFQNIERRKYLENLKLLPKLRDQQTQTYLTLAFTFAALSIFGLFAINPTLATIVDLQKQLKDSEEIRSQLEKKVANLRELQIQYAHLEPDLSYVEKAIPPKPKTPYLLGQVQALAQQASLTLSAFQSYPVELTRSKALPGKQGTGPSYLLSVQAHGTYEQISSFIAAFTKFDRIATIDNIAITRGEKADEPGLKLTLKARAYFK